MLSIKQEHCEPNKASTENSSFRKLFENLIHLIIYCMNISKYFLGTCYLKIKGVPEIDFHILVM